MNAFWLTAIVSRRHWKRTTRAVTKLAAMVLAIAVAPEWSDAQQSVSGVIVESVSGQPLAGAQVVVTGTQLRAIADEAGRFRLVGVTGPTVTLRVTMLGYTPIARAVQVDDPNIRIELERAAVGLEGVIITATGQQRLRGGRKFHRPDSRRFGDADGAHHEPRGDARGTRRAVTVSEWYLDYARSEGAVFAQLAVDFAPFQRGGAFGL